MLATATVLLELVPVTDEMMFAVYRCSRESTVICVQRTYLIYAEQFSVRFSNVCSSEALYVLTREGVWRICLY